MHQHCAHRVGFEARDCSTRDRVPALRPLPGRPIHAVVADTAEVLLTVNGPVGVEYGSAGSAIVGEALVDDAFLRTGEFEGRRHAARVEV